VEEACLSPSQNYAEFLFVVINASCAFNFALILALYTQVISRNQVVVLLNNLLSAGQDKVEDIINSDE